MALTGRHNIAAMWSTTTGTGTLTLTTAVSGYNTFANAGAVTGERLRFTIFDGANTEVSEGIYTSAGLTLTRATVLSSTNSGSKIDCSGRQYVGITLPAEDITPFASYYGTVGDTVANTATDSALTLDTEQIDECAMASVAANAVTIAKKGWYQMSVSILVSGGAAFNGRFSVHMGDFGDDPQKGYTTAMGIQDDMITIGPILINATTDSYSLGTVSFTNNLGGSVDARVFELTILKVGNK
jgi:hypothetical protein